MDFSTVLLKNSFELGQYFFEKKISLQLFFIVLSFQKMEEILNCYLYFENLLLINNLKKCQNIIINQIEQEEIQKIVWSESLETYHYLRLKYEIQGRSEKFF